MSSRTRRRSKPRRSSRSSRHASRGRHRSSRRGSSSRKNRSRARTLRVKARRKQKKLKLKYSRHGWKKARRHGRSVRGKWSTVKRYRRKAHNPKHYPVPDQVVDGDSIQNSSKVVFSGPYVLIAHGDDMYGRGSGAKKGSDIRQRGSDLTGRQILKLVKHVYRMAAKVEASRFFETLEITRKGGVRHIELGFGS